MWSELQQTIENAPRSLPPPSFNYPILKLRSSPMLFFSFHFFLTILHIGEAHTEYISYIYKKLNNDFLGGKGRKSIEVLYLRRREVHVVNVSLKDVSVESLGHFVVIALQLKLPFFFYSICKFVASL